MKVYYFLSLIIFLFLSCSSPSIPNNKNLNQNNTEKGNDDLTIRDRVGTYRGKGNFYDTWIELTISEQGNLKLQVIIKRNNETRTITSNIDISDKMNYKDLNVLYGTFYDSHLPDVETSKIILIFTSPTTADVTFFVHPTLWGSNLEKL